MTQKTEKFEKHDKMIQEAEVAYNDIARASQDLLHDIQEPARKRQRAVINELLWASGSIGQDFPVVSPPPP